MLRSGGKLPTAVFCTSDDGALGLIEAARDAGVSCPQELSVAGFGNQTSGGPETMKELTTLNWSEELGANETVRLLDAQIDGKQEEPEVVNLPVNLLVRSSCDRPRRGDVKRKT
jgi:DNA-binding LacI/PurR family transcriptional regulator